MQALCDKAFANAAFAGDEHVDIGLCELGKGLAQHIDFARLSQNRTAVRCGGLFAQAAVFKHQRPLVERAAQRSDQSIAVERLRQEIIGTAADEIDGRRDIVVAGHHDNRQFGVAAHQAVEQAAAIEAGHAQVGNHNTCEIGVDPCQRRFGVGKFERIPLFEFEHLPQRTTDIRLVVDNRDGGHTVRRHGATFSMMTNLAPRADGARRSSPPKPAMISWQMTSQRPRPSSFEVVNGWNRRSRMSGAIPGPESWSTIVAKSPETATSIALIRAVSAPISPSAVAAFCRATGIDQILLKNSHLPWFPMTFGNNDSSALRMPHHSCL